MAKKQAQFRFEEDFFAGVSEMAEKEGLTVSEMVRNALKFYIAIYERTKDKNAKLIIESVDERCEVILPWLF